MSEDIRAYGPALLLASIVCLAVVGIGGVSAQQQATVAVNLTADSVADGNTVNESVAFEAVDDTDGVGSFTVELTWDPSAVSVTASDHSNSEFDVETSSPSDGTLRVTGYTGNNPGPTGNGVLFAVQVTGENPTDSASVNATIDSFTDAEGDALPVSLSNDTIDVTAGGGGGGGGGGFGGSGGGLAEPSTDAPTTDTPTSGTTDTSGPTATDAPDDQPTAAADTATSAATEAQSTESTGGSGPGFGVAAAVIAGLAAAGLAARRQP